MRDSLVRGVATMILSSIAAGCAAARDVDEASGAIVFRVIGQESGVDFRYRDGSRGRRDLPEVMGGGVALIDVDGDGLLDLYFCNGGPIGAEQTGVRDDTPCRTYRNLGGGRFEDATARTGAPGPSYAMGVAVGDYDGDGRDDLFVTGWGGRKLYRNIGAGRFEDATARAGVESTLWSTGAAFADLDRDGDLDLFVANYLAYDAALAPYCAAPDGRRDYCGPEDFPAQPDVLYRNNGDGTFTDVARAAGVDLPDGRGLGVLVADLVGDSALDLYVANDGTPCRLFENLGGLRFREVAMEAGVALDANGVAPAGMGVALGDIDGDGRPDLVVTNFYARGTIGFRARGRGMFLDESAALGISGPTRKATGFGVALEDFNGDGRLDLIEANGHVVERARLGVPFAMRSTLLRNEGGRLVDVSKTAGPAFGRAMLGRGLAVGDLDDDGKPDVVLAALDAPPLLLRNESKGGRWVAVELVPRGGGGVFGARVTARIAGRLHLRDRPGGGSYLSSSSRTVWFGLGAARGLESLEVAWPSGRVERWEQVPAGIRLIVREGEARLETGPARRSR